jgi:hypothetical protein
MAILSRRVAQALFLTCTLQSTLKGAAPPKTKFEIEFSSNSPALLLRGVARSAG